MPGWKRLRRRRSCAGPRIRSALMWRPVRHSKPTSVPLLHIISRICPDLPILFVDTGYHFPETLQFRDDLREAWHLRVTTVGPLLSRPCYPAPCDADLCCHLRKVEPMQRALQCYRAWITGIRRDQTAQRRNVRVLERQAGGLVKVNPLVNWTRADVEAYRARHILPAHPLYAYGYRSVGCAPCTRAVQDGQDDRAGRWVGLDKTECGLHWSPDRGPVCRRLVAVERT